MLPILSILSTHLPALCKEPSIPVSFLVFTHSNDRKAEEEFKLCEVIVFGAGGGELAEGKEECGDPELGVGAVLEGPSRSHERKVVCSEGLELEGGGSAATIRCQDGRWNSSSVHCRPPSCQTPPPVKGAKVEVLGSRAIYSCSVPGRFDLSLCGMI